MPFQSNINGYDKNGINIDEQLGKNIPLDVKFVNSMGPVASKQKVTLC